MSGLVTAPSHQGPETMDSIQGTLRAAESKGEIRSTIMSLPAVSSETLELSKAVPQPQNGTRIQPDHMAKLQETLDHINDGIGEITSTIKDVAPRFKAVSKADDDPENTNDKTDGRPDDESSGKDDGELDGEPEEELGFATTIVSEVKERDWEGFKSRYPNDDAIYAVEALISGSSLKQEKEEWDRKVAGIISKSPHAEISPRLYKDHESEESGKETWIHQVRINSRAVIKTLGKVNDKSLGDRPLIFTKPFRYLIYFHDKMKEELNTIESRLIETKDLDSPQNSGNGVESGPTKEADKMAAGSDGKEPNEADSVSKPLIQKEEGNAKAADPDATLLASREAAAEMRCYVNFVENRLMPAYNQFRGAASASPQQVRFEDLWYLFKVGGLIYVPKTADTPAASSHQAIWRVYRIQIPIIDTKNLDLDCDCSICKSMKAYTEWTVECYSIDYDGGRYGAITKTLKMNKFSGEKDITQLPFYPLYFVKDYQEILNEARRDGRKFAKLIGERYGFYAGWTLTKDSSGESLTDSHDKPIRSPEHLESDVLVDFEEAFNTQPAWKPSFTRVSNQQSKYWTFTDDSKIIKFKLKHAKGSSLELKLDKIYKDKVINNDGIESLELNSLLETDQYLVKQDENLQEPSDDDLALLPRHLIAYAVWSRKFVHIDVRGLHLRGEEPDKENGDKDRPKKDAFELLEIEPQNKQLILSLVHSHFIKKDMESRGIEIGSQDLIRGKGKGVVILLHGVPGVGKTATAEAVAQRWKKPLFPITCGDLGFTPESVQKELEEIFRLAHLWDCVLLLDEADVFITQREKNDLQRNALVSVFLRMLEYYNGILFLTTNRAGVLDEAVKSRVHLNLRYDHLNKEQTIAVFKINITRLRNIEKQHCKHPKHKQLFIDEADVLKFAGDHFDRMNKDGSLSIGRWNGRQIRNAFLIAASLAHYESASKDPNLQKQLRATHFQDVEKATLLYDQFRVDVLGDTDNVMANRRGERDFPKDEENIPPHENYPPTQNIPPLQNYPSTQNIPPTQNYPPPQNYPLPQNIPLPQGFDPRAHVNSRSQ